MPRGLLVLALVAASGGVLPSPAQEHAFPDEHYPAYPGSWWKYRTELSGAAGVQAGTRKVVAAPRYRIVPLHDGSGCKPESHFAPMVGEQEDACADGAESGLSPVYGTRRKLPGLGGCNFLADFIRKVEGDSWSYPVGTGGRCGGSIYRCDVRTVMSADTSLPFPGGNFDSLIHIRWRKAATYDTVDEFYRRGVGLVHMVERYNYPARTLTWTLEDHRIDPERRKDQQIRVDSLAGIHAGGALASRWGNRAAINSSCSTLAGTAVTVEMRVPEDTVTVAARATSGLPLRLTVHRGGERRAEGGGFILENRWSGIELSLEQEGNGEYRPAWTFRGILCVLPRVLVAYDTAAGILRAPGWPDDRIVWRRSPDGFGEGVAAWRGAAAPASVAGHYTATVDSGAYEDAVCGRSPRIVSSTVRVDEANGVGPPDGPEGMRLVLFGNRIRAPLPAGGVAPKLRVADAAGRPVPVRALPGPDGSLAAAAPAGLRPGVYLYDLEAGGKRARGKAIHPVP